MLPLDLGKIKRLVLLVKILPRGFNDGGIALMGAFSVGQGGGSCKTLHTIDFGGQQRAICVMGVFAHLVKVSALHGD